MVWLGSSNLAQGGECANGDNLIAKYDQDIATVFAIEAFALVDHFNLRDKFGTNHNPVISPKGTKKTTKPKKQVAVKLKKTSTPKPQTGVKPMTLTNDDTWCKRYYDTSDLKNKERNLFS